MVFFERVHVVLNSRGRGRRHGLVRLTEGSQSEKACSGLVGTEVQLVGVESQLLGQAFDVLTHLGDIAVGDAEELVEQRKVVAQLARRAFPICRLRNTNGNPQSDARRHEKGLESQDSVDVGTKSEVSRRSERGVQGKNVINGC